MLLAHGVGKWMGFSNIAPHFPDPLGLGSKLSVIGLNLFGVVLPDPLGLGSKLSLILVIGSELFGAVLLALGLFTRWASFSLLFTMLVATFITHGPDPFKVKELAFLYALVFVLFTVAGGGKYSLDSLLKKEIKKK